VISNAATGWSTQGIGFGYSAGVTGRAKVEQYQRFSNFRRSKNVPQAPKSWKWPPGFRPQKLAPRLARIARSALKQPRLRLMLRHERAATSLDT
jgi:hypothetical protein